MKRTVWTTIISGISGVLLGLIVSRLLYEAFFPLMAWSGRPWGALLWALVGAGLTSLTSKKDRLVGLATALAKFAMAAHTGRRSPPKPPHIRGDIVAGWGHGRAQQHPRLPI